MFRQAPSAMAETASVQVSWSYLERNTIADLVIRSTQKKTQGGNRQRRASGSGCSQAQLAGI
jgi:hypothetical protein